MKSYRLIAFAAAVLITVFIARVLSDQQIGVRADQAATVAQAP